MTFVRTKVIRGRVYRYLVESYRDDQGRPRQRVVEYLGRVDEPKSTDGRTTKKGRRRKGSRRQKERTR